MGVKPEYGEPVEAGEYRGTFKTTGDKEHAEIVRLYVEEEMSMGKIALKLARSSGTVHRQIKKHNRAVEREWEVDTKSNARSERPFRIIYLQPSPPLYYV